VLTLCGWLAGFVPNSFGRDVSQAQLGVAFVATLSATWIAALIDPKSPVRLDRWRMALRASQGAALLVLAPAWRFGRIICYATSTDSWI
jgi:drug/metabolite transporter superfamily protein YnfA